MGFDLIGREDFGNAFQANQIVCGHGVLSEPFF
jgi:hypothetical protein